MPAGVRRRWRMRRSLGSGTTFSKLRLERVFTAAVRVVRSMPSSWATELMVAGGTPGMSGRLRLMRSENWPLLMPAGLRASSKRRARARAARWT